MKEVFRAAIALVSKVARRKYAACQKHGPATPPVDDDFWRELAAMALIALTSMVSPISAAAESSSVCGEETISVSVPRRVGTICGGSYRDMVSVGWLDEVVTLPDIIIAEKSIGALRPEGYIGLANYGDPSWGFSSFDISRATLKAYRTNDNADFTAYIIGGSTLTTYQRNHTVGMSFKLHNASDAYTGPVTIVLSGVRAKLRCSTCTLLIGGAEVADPDMSLPENDGRGLGCMLGSRANLSKVTVAYGIFEVFRFVNYCNENGPITNLRTNCEVNLRWPYLGTKNLFGTPGSFFVFAEVVSDSDISGLYAKNAKGDWQRVTSCADMPAYSTGALGDCSFDVFNQPADVTSIKGTRVYAGYGKAPMGSPPGAACEDLIWNGDYIQIYTVPPR